MLPLCLLNLIFQSLQESKWSNVAFYVLFIKQWLKEEYGSFSMYLRRCEHSACLSVSCSCMQRTSYIHSEYFYYIKKKKKSHVCAKCSSQRHIICPNLSSFSSGFLREACLPCQVGSAGTQLLSTVCKTSQKLKIILSTRRSAFFLPQTQHEFVFAVWIVFALAFQKNSVQGKITRSANTGKI